MNAAAAREEVRSWPVPERLEFLFQVWDDLVDGGWRPTLTADLQAELDRRWADHLADPSRARTWDQVAARLGRPS